MKSVRLPHYLDFLQAQTAKTFKGDAVDRFLRDTVVEADDFLPYAFFREDTYGRNLVFKNDFFELLVLTWLPKHRTPIHDHAGQRCWMTITEGQLCFRNYLAEDGQKKTCELRPNGRAETGRAGRTVYIDDGLGIHSIANASERPAVSVHLYAAPIERCRIYDEAERAFKSKDLCYFTAPDLVSKKGSPQAR